MSTSPSREGRRRHILGVPLADAPWLFYLAFLLLQPFVDPSATARSWLVIGASLVLFLPLYGWTHRVIDARPWLYRNGVAGGLFGVVGMLALTLLVAPLNPGAGTFAVYAAAAGGKLRPRRRALLAIAAAFVALIVGALISPTPLIVQLVSFGAAALLVPVIGLTTLFQRERHADQQKLRMAQAEVEQLATIAERERIARDLHDLLGHTLSTITLKAELASHLAATDPERAAEEMRDVERLSRETLAEVRSAVTGYRGSGFGGELANAKLALEAAGMELDYFVRPLPLQPAAEGVLALALREAVTNVVRHAGAKRCRVTLDADGAHVLLTVEDDGVGTAGQGEPGSGLQSMRERARALGGYVTLAPSRAANQSGMRLDVGIPASAALLKEPAA